MSNVRLDKVPVGERYVNLAFEGNILKGPMLANLKSLYEFIDNNSPGRSFWKYGNAYRAILKKARMLAGSRRYIISKRQVASLICAEGDEYVSSVKIPYTVDYIFRAIFEIFEGYKNNQMVSVPTELLNLYDEVRRDVFYGIQSSQYEYKYKNNLLNNREDLSDIRRALLNDLCSDECSLGKRV